MRSVDSELAVVLRRTEFGESDLIVGLYCRSLGKISAIARGARRSKKRFAGSIGLFTVSEVSLSTKPKATLWSLEQAESKQDFTALASDVIAMAHGSYGTELVRELSAAEQPDPILFDLLVELYCGLAKHGPKVGRLRVFELRLLSGLGLTPVLTRCVRCQGVLGAVGMHWAPQRGGVLCQECAAVDLGPQLRPISADAIDYLITAQSIARLEGGDGLEKGTVAVEARGAMLALLYWHVGKPLKSVEFMAKLHG